MSWLQEEFSSLPGETVENNERFQGLEAGKKEPNVYPKRKIKCFRSICKTGPTQKKKPLGKATLIQMRYYMKLEWLLLAAFVGFFFFFFLRRTQEGKIQPISGSPGF